MQDGSSSQTVDEIPMGEYATPIECFYRKYGEEVVKRQVPFLNDVLRQLLTASIGLMGGGVFLGEAVCSPIMRSIALVAFFCGTLAALIGVMPFYGVITLGMPYKIRDQIESMARMKSAFAITAGCLVVVGLLCAGVGTMTK